MNKKGQAAMEFLMTYGWAILVVIAAIAALAYFGVLDPARLLPERCQSAAGMDCIDKASIRTTQIEFALRNNIGFGIEVIGANASTGFNAECEVFINNVELNNPASTTNVTVTNNGVFKVRLSGCASGTPAAGDKFDGNVVVRYINKESTLTNQVTVDIRGKTTA